MFTQPDPIGLRGGLNLYAYGPDPLGWIDPLGLTCTPTEPNWTNHGYKHFPPKNNSWKDILKSTKTGPAKYKPEIDIEALERSVFKDGTPVTNGKTWKVKEMDDLIGASEGKDSKWIRVEESGGTIHGHPISLAECLRLTKS
nr:RHS repeat-associated core domain-containing protein [Winslowiella iniecta]